jgi:oxygen-independent coproporphyrinogen-3 oxidase
MWTYLPELLARPVPRYTSYPTAMEFVEGFGAAEYEQALADVGADQPVSLYVHIPFCDQICWYCGCNTGAAGRKQRLSDYLRALEREIARVAKSLNGRGKVARISFGGGSPNAVSQVDFVRLVDRIMTLFHCQSPDISVEIDPRHFADGWVSVMAMTGVRRVSFGVQSFAPHVQAAIGRVQPLEMIEESVRSLRAHGISEVNFDLMFGLPEQSLADMDESLAQTIRLAPSRISLFGYAHLPDLLPRQRRIDASHLPDHALRFEQAALGYQRLTAAGYVAVGFDHFALPHDPLAIAAAEGRVRRNFQGFTDDQAEVLIGMGASAISQFPNLIVQNEKRSGVYRDQMAADDSVVVRGVRLEDDDRRRGTIIRDILCHSHARIDARYRDEARDVLALYESQGLLSWDGDRLDIADHALPYRRLIASEFDRKRGAITGQYAFA